MEGFSIPNFGSIPKGWPQASDALRDSQLKVRRMNKTDVCSKLVLMTPRIGREDCVYDMCI
jgi:hypothetical protein